MSFPDELWEIIFYHLNDNPIDDQLILKTYFSLPLVCSQFNRIVLKQKADWEMMKCHRTMNEELARKAIYFNIATIRFYTITKNLSFHGQTYWDFASEMTSFMLKMRKAEEIHL
jgi:hypothetical protein